MYTSAAAALGQRDKAAVSYHSETPDLIDLDHRVLAVVP